MKVLVIGGGVVGMATAYYLVQAGLDVTVLEREEDVGLETSAGNAGFYSPSDAFAWGSPSVFKLALKSAVNPELGLRVTKRWDPQLWRWMAAFVGQCSNGAYRRNSQAKYRLATYSLEMLNQLRLATGIDFDASDTGLMFASRNNADLQKSKQHFALLEGFGLRLQHLDEEGLIDKMPVLKASAGTYAGAVYSPDCVVGDSAKFSQELVKLCRTNKNFHIEYGANVERILTQNHKISAVLTSKGEFTADAYILAAGPESGQLSRQIGFRLPIYPIKGFSISAPILDRKLAPSVGFDDTERLVTASTLGDRLRMSSSAVFDGFGTCHQPSDFRSIIKLAREIFPGAADYDKATYWAGLRPMTPASKPILGASPVQNLFLNVGHGHLGWTMSCGTGKVVADIVVGKIPDIRIADFQFDGV